MMTAEQFDFQAEYDKYLADGFSDPVRFAKFCVNTIAAQLAEKEREIADLQTQCRDIAVALGNQIARAEAAEQRLKEAQAEIKLLRHNRNEALKGEDDTD